MVKPRAFSAYSSKDENIKKAAAVSVPEVLDERKSPWFSLWISIYMQFVIGIQISIYYMSMWPYLSMLDKSATMDFLGWVVAVCSLGCTLTNPLFGAWNQRNMSVSSPTACGFIIASLGQMLYGLLPIFDSNRKWIMFGARFVTGAGAGSLAVLRAYVATAPTSEDRMKAISYGTAGYVLGLSFGPAVQAAFTAVGEDGFKIGPIVCNMYTMPAFFLAATLLISAVVMKVIFHEEYSGILEQDESEDNRFSIIPDFDVFPAFTCIFMWIACSMIATNMEVLSTPFTQALYDWNNSKAVLVNSLLQTASCLVSVCIYLLQGYTRFGHIDKRKQMLVGLTIFMAYYVANYPWPFYSGPLHYMPNNTDTSSIGGCDPTYSWCAHTTRVPLPLYMFCFIAGLGLAFPLISSPSASLYSEILGPRKQGFMQGLYSLGGSAAQFVTPVYVTYLFERTGYQWLVVTELVVLAVSVLLVVVLYRRLIPLKLRPEEGDVAKYKEGVFSTL